MPPSSKPLVVPSCCRAMAVALEVVAEHRRERSRADVAEEAAAAEARQKEARRREGRARAKR